MPAGDGTGATIDPDTVITNKGTNGFPVINPGSRRAQNVPHPGVSGPSSSLQPNLSSQLWGSSAAWVANHVN